MCFYLFFFKYKLKCMIQHFLKCARHKGDVWQTNITALGDIITSPLPLLELFLYFLWQFGSLAVCLSALWVL